MAAQRIGHKAASNSSKRSLCTNLPAKCPVCPGDVLVWSYHMLDHLESAHPEHPISEELLKQYAISRAEFIKVIDQFKKGGADSMLQRLCSQYPAPATAPAKWRLLLAAELTPE